MGFRCYLSIYLCISSSVSEHHLARNRERAKIPATKGASTAPSCQISHHRPSLTSVVMPLPWLMEHGNWPFLACCASRISLSFHRSINQAWKSSRVSSGMSDTLNRRQCMWMGAWGCLSKYVDRSVKMSCPYWPSLWTVNTTSMTDLRFGLTEHRRRPGCSRTPTPRSPPTLSGRNTSPYSWESACTSDPSRPASRPTSRSSLSRSYSNSCPRGTSSATSAATPPDRHRSDALVGRVVG